MSLLHGMLQMSMYLASKYCRLDIGGSTEVQTSEPYLGNVQAEFTIDKHCELMFYLNVDERRIKFGNNGWPYPGTHVPKRHKHSCSISANYNAFGERNYVCFYFTADPVFNGTCYQSEIVVFNRPVSSSTPNTHNISLPFRVCGVNNGNDSQVLDDYEDIAANDSMTSSAYNTSHLNTTVQTRLLNFENMTDTPQLNFTINDFINEPSTEPALHVAPTTVARVENFENFFNFDYNDYDNEQVLDGSLNVYTEPRANDYYYDELPFDATTKRVYQTVTTTPATTPRVVILTFCIKLCIQTGIGLITTVKIPRENHCIGETMKRVNQDMNHELEVPYTWDIKPYTCFDVPEHSLIIVEVSQAEGVDSIPFARDVIGASYPIEHSFTIPPYHRLNRGRLSVKCLASGCRRSADSFARNDNLN